MTGSTASCSAGGLGGSSGGNGDKKKEYKNGKELLTKPPTKPRGTKVKLTAENDNKLLVIPHSRQLSTKGYALMPPKP